MSTPETPAAPALTPREQDIRDKVLSTPVDWPGTTKSYLEDFITSVLPTQKWFEALIAKIAHPVGFWLIVPDDLTAQTGVYEYTHPLTGLKYLYCNGAAASQTTYADLYALWGASKYGADSGGNFLLPDTRGRPLWFAGTHANTDVGDNDGVAEASRQPSHAHTVAALTVTGAPSLGTLAVSGAPGLGTLAVNPASHSHTGGNDTTVASPGAGAGIAVGATSGAATGSTGLTVTGAPSLGTLAVSGAPGVGTLDVGGVGGSGMSASDATAHIVIGSLVVRF